MSETDEFVPPAPLERRDAPLDEAGSLDDHGRPEARWRVPDDLEELGPVQDSALTTPYFLLRRRDGQVVQVSELLHTVVSELRDGGSRTAVADAVSDAYGRRLTVEGLDHLVEKRLVPLGLVESDRTPVRDLPTATPILALTLRGVLLPGRVVNPVARALRPVFWPPVIATALVGFVLTDLALLRSGDLLAALEQLLLAPETMLVLYALLALGTVVHELGHATGCRYGGATPGSIGFGVYLVFPAFYTDVTDAYRLGRAGRLRTDLGGLYFNVLVIIALAWGYLLTGNGLFLLAVLIMHFEMLQQLVPAVRFDGYYVLADLVGVPDLFARVGPTLSSLVPGRPLDPRVAELKPVARRVIAGWVVVVVPALLFGLGWLLWHLPLIVQRTVVAAGFQLEQLTAAWGDGRLSIVALSSISLVFLVLPLLGISVLLWRLLDALGRGVWQRHVRRGEQTSGDTMESTTRRFSAAAFNDTDMLPAQPEVASIGWQHTLYRVSGHTLKPRPGAEERRRAERAEAMRTPIVGTRRVVVMSRKGGVGKTTISLALGSILATERGDRVVAVDANPDAGNLAHRVAPVNRLTITDVLRDLDDIQTYADLKRYTSQAPETRLEVLASDDDTRIGWALDRNDYHRLIDLLDRFYNLILLDTGTGILDSANQGLLAEADELVLVLRPGLDGGRAAALTLDWLEDHDYGDLVSGAVVVINAARRGVGAPIEPIREHFEHRCRRVVTVPWDPVLETGAQTRMSTLDKATVESLLEMAAAVAEHFPTCGRQR